MIKTLRQFCEDEKIKNKRLWKFEIEDVKSFITTLYQSEHYHFSRHSRPCLFTRNRSFRFNSIFMIHVL